jgi:hypothetical protein
VGTVPWEHMTDPGGGLGWRSARHLPRQRGGIFGWGRMADEAALLGEDRPLCVLLLPQVLEAFSLRERAEDLLTAPGVAAVDPPRLSYAALVRLGDAVAEGLTAVEARRLRLPGFPRAIVVFHPLQYPLARALVSLHPDAELWYGGADAPRGARLEILHALARDRAALRFDHTDAPAHAQNLPLWERMEALGIESGRLGSERPDVVDH